MSAGSSTPDTKGTVPDISAIQNGVSIDRTSVTLSATNPRDVLTIVNNLPGPTHLKVEETEFGLKGVDVESIRPIFNTERRLLSRLF